MDCQFSTPLDIGSEARPDWEFSIINCLVDWPASPEGSPPTTTEEIYDLVVNPDYPEREFYVEKTFSYGDALIVFFLTLFLIFGIAKGVFNFFWKK